MSDKFDAGLEALTALIAAEANRPADDRNEATTRYQVLDTIVRDVLTWDDHAVTCEERAGTGRIDYALGFPARQFLIEAKRENITFSLPAGTKHGVHSLKSLTHGPEAKALADAVQQAMNYASSNGIQIAAVANGHQLILFVGARVDGVSQSDGKALVFTSLEDMQMNFRALWDAASPAGIDNRNLLQLLVTTVSQPPLPLSSRLPVYPGMKKRNDLQADLEILGDLFLEDLAKIGDMRDQFLRDCYATSGALSQHASISKNILESRYAALDFEGSTEAVAAQGKRGLAPQLTRDMLATATNRRPIVLLGDVGVGKSTFIQRLVHVDAADLFAQAFTVYIDFGSSTTLADLREHVLMETIKQLSTLLGTSLNDNSFAQSVHRKALKDFDSSPSGQLREIDEKAYKIARLQFLQGLVDDRPGHIAASIKNIQATRRKQVVVFLDNVDQRSTDDQDQVFLISNELASTWNATVFVTLRPETFYQSKRTGALSGYQSRVFTISPPRADVVLTKRIQFALRNLHGIGQGGLLPANVSVSSEKLETFLQMLEGNLRTNKGLMTLIDNMASGNMRLALQFVSDFIGSSHIATGKMLDIVERFGRYDIPVHEFLRALLYKGHEHFDPSASDIANVLRLRDSDGRAHFLIPLIISFSQSRGDQISGEGFVEAAEIFTFSQLLGFTDLQSREALDQCIREKLLESTPRSIENRDRIFYRVTSAGVYTVRTLLGFFTYVDAIIVDTPITDRAVREEIGDAYSIKERLNRAKAFKAYLDSQWDRIDDSDLPWNWSEISKVLQQDIDRVESKAVAPYERG